MSEPGRSRRVIRGAVLSAVAALVLAAVLSLDEAWLLGSLVGAGFSAVILLAMRRSWRTQRTLEAIADDASRTAESARSFPFRTRRRSGVVLVLRPRGEGEKTSAG